MLTIRWIGGKRLLAKKIATLIPPDHTCYMEPFFGSGSVLFAKPRSRVEIANDIDGDLITLFKVVKERPEELVEWFRLRIVSENMFKEMVAWRPTQDIDIAGRFLYLNKICFSGEVSSPYLAVSAKSGGASKHMFLLSLKDDVNAMYKRAAAVTFLNRRAEDVLPIADEETVVYLDPPYYGTRGYRFETDWDFLLGWVATTKSRVIFSINKCDFVDENLVPLFVNVIEEKVSYSLSKDGSGRKKNAEYILTNFVAGNEIVGKTVEESDMSGTMFDIGNNEG